MAGHSKWKQIKRKKAVTDQKRASQWTKIIREITVAAKMGGGDPDGNPRLRLAIDNAKAANMPNDNIDRAIKKGTGELEGVQYQEVAYEGYGHGGAALYIETLTDNANRTVADLRFTMNKYGGSLGTSGSVAWQFDRKGQIWVDAKRYDEESTLMAALEAGAEDMQTEDGQYIITTEMTSFAQVQDALRQAGIAIDSAELAMVPKNTVDVRGEDAQKLVRLMEMIEELDDVQKVSTNAELDEAALAEAGA